MPSRDNPWERIGQVIANIISSYTEAQPPLKARKRAVYSSFMITCGVYLAYIKIGETLHQLVTHPGAIAWADLGQSVIAWLVVMLFAAMWLVAGLRHTQVQRDPMTLFWGIVWLACSVILVFGSLLHDIHSDKQVDWNACLWGSLGASVMSVYLSIRGPGRSAQKAVFQEIAQHEIRWRRVGR